MECSTRYGECKKRHAPLWAKQSRQSCLIIITAKRAKALVSPPSDLTECLQIYLDVNSWQKGTFKHFRGNLYPIWLGYCVLLGGVKSNLKERAPRNHFLEHIDSFFGPDGGGL